MVFALLITGPTCFTSGIAWLATPSTFCVPLSILENERLLPLNNLENRPVRVVCILSGI